MADGDTAPFTNKAKNKASRNRNTKLAQARDKREYGIPNGGEGKHSTPFHSPMCESILHTQHCSNESCRVRESITFGDQE